MLDERDRFLPICIPGNYWVTTETARAIVANIENLKAAIDEYDREHS
jgi:hypothetical protein